MIRHVVAFSFREDADRAARDAVLEELARFPARFPAMRRFALNRNISQRDTTYTHAFFVEFDDEAALVSYLSSAAHEEFVERRWRPVIAARAIASIEA